MSTARAPSLRREWTSPLALALAEDEAATPLCPPPPPSPAREAEADVKERGREACDLGLLEDGATCRPFVSPLPRLPPPLLLLPPSGAIDESAAEVAAMALLADPAREKKVPLLPPAC